MVMQFICNGKKIWEIPLREATTENKLWIIDMLAESYEVEPCEISTRIN